MNQLQAMRVFTRVVDLASFNLAARQLGMSAAAVTRSVSMLEAHLNMRLLNRTTRSLSLTEVGKEYLDGCRTIIEKLDEMESNLVQTTRDPRGTLRIATPMTFATSGLGTLARVVSHAASAGGFRRYHLRYAYRHGRGRLRRVLLRRPAPRQLHAGKPHADQHRGSHGCLAQLSGTPRHAARPCRAEPSRALLTVSDGTSRAWEFADADGVYRVNTGSALTATSSAMVRVAALNHMGIALLPLPFVSDDLQQGTLVPVLEQFEVNGGPRHVSILYSGRNYLSMKVRSFIDFAVSQYRAPDKPVALRVVA